MLLYLILFIIGNDVVFKCICKVHKTKENEYNIRHVVDSINTQNTDNIILNTDNKFIKIIHHFKTFLLSIYNFFYKIYLKKTLYRYKRLSEILNFTSASRYYNEEKFKEEWIIHTEYDLDIVTNANSFLFLCLIKNIDTIGNTINIDRYKLKQVISTYNNLLSYNKVLDMFISKCEQILSDFMLVHNTVTDLDKAKLKLSVLPLIKNDVILNYKCLSEKKKEKCKNLFKMFINYIEKETDETKKTFKDENKVFKEYIFTMYNDDLGDILHINIDYDPIVSTYNKQHKRIYLLGRRYNFKYMIKHIDLSMLDLNKYKQIKSFINKILKYESMTIEEEQAYNILQDMYKTLSRDKFMNISNDVKVYITDKIRRLSYEVQKTYDDYILYSGDTYIIEKKRNIYTKNMLDLILTLFEPRLRNIVQDNKIIIFKSTFKEIFS